MILAVLWPLEKRQTKREERSLVIPNKRRTTPYGVFLGAIRRAELIFYPAVLSLIHVVQPHDTRSAGLDKK